MFLYVIFCSVCDSTLGEVFSEYMKQRLIKVAPGRRRMKSGVGPLSTIPSEMVTPRGGARHVYVVQSHQHQDRFILLTSQSLFVHALWGDWSSL